MIPRCTFGLTIPPLPAEDPWKPCVDEKSEPKAEGPLPKDTELPEIAGPLKVDDAKDEGDGVARETLGVVVKSRSISKFA